MEKPSYGRFRLGVRGRRGKRRENRMLGNRQDSGGPFQALSLLQHADSSVRFRGRRDGNLRDASRSVKAHNSSQRSLQHDVNETYEQVETQNGVNGELGPNHIGINNGVLDVQTNFASNEIEHNIAGVDQASLDIPEAEELDTDELFTIHEEDSLFSNRERIKHFEHVANQEETERFTQVPTKWKKVCRWQSIFAFLLLNGTRRLSVEQYDMVHVVINFLMRLCFPHELPLPSASSVRRTVQPFLERTGYVESELRSARSNLATSEAQESSMVNPTSAASNVTIIVTPSAAWSCMDVMFKPTWNILKRAAAGEPSDTSICFSTIEDTPMLTNRPAILGIAETVVPTALAPGVEKTPMILAERHSEYPLTVRLKKVPDFPASVKAAFNFVEDDEECRLQGKAVATAMVTPNCGGESINETAENQSLITFPQHLRSAIKTPMSGLWKSGDICTVMEGIENVNGVVVLVQEHTPRNGEQPRMKLVWIPFINTERNVTMLYLEKASITGINDLLFFPPPGATPVPKPVRATSYGRLEDGRLYFVDRILLYSDGFSQYNFKQGSVGGVYALSLNYPPHFRRSRDTRWASNRISNKII